MDEVFISLGVCVVMPVLIVWIVFRSAVISDRLRAQVLIKAIESNADIDADKIAEAMQKPRKTPAERQRSRLLWGSLFSLLGLGAAIFAAVMLCTDPKAGMHRGFFIGSGVCLAIGISYLVVYFVTRKSEKV